jgi:nucleotide-binding universal stress UspA family protein
LYVACHAPGFGRSQARDCPAEIGQLLRRVEQLDAKLTLFHVWDVPERVGGASGALDFDRLRKDRERAEEAFYNLYQQTRSRHLATDCFFLAGDPCALVVSAAKTLSIDLIVFGRHHRSWLSELIGRSDTERIARSADCPLLIVR